MSFKKKDFVQQAFSHIDWEKNPICRMARELYVFFAKCADDFMEHSSWDSDHQKERIGFFLQLMLESVHPENSPWINPQIMKKTLRSEGKNIEDGMRRFREDFVRGGGIVRPRMVTKGVFRLGENIAATPGEIVFQNKLFQLIYYRPEQSKSTQSRTEMAPILIVPSWINKYYIFDLTKEYSFTKWLLENGFPVFTISWVNPGPELSEASFQEYIFQGLFMASLAVRAKSGHSSIHFLGYCAGGNLLACFLSYLAAHHQEWAISATYLATPFDFSKIGDLRFFLESPFVELCFDQMEKRGVLDGATLNDVFIGLRPRKLFWSFFLRNYFLGGEGVRLAPLFWNDDFTRAPKVLESEYIIHFFIRNALMKKNGFFLEDIPVDLSRIRCPAFLLSAEKDHITPWKSCRAGDRLFGGPSTFVLTESGHVAGVFNHPKYGKGGYTVGENALEDGQEERHEGSWWLFWIEWLKKQVAPPKSPIAPIDTTPIESAPGSYVMMK